MLGSVWHLLSQNCKYHFITVLHYYTLLHVASLCLTSLVCMVWSFVSHSRLYEKYNRQVVIRSYFFSHNKKRLLHTSRVYHKTPVIRNNTCFKKDKYSNYRFLKLICISYKCHLQIITSIERNNLWSEKLTNKIREMHFKICCRV